MNKTYVAFNVNILWKCTGGSYTVVTSIPLATAKIMELRLGKETFYYFIRTSRMYEKIDVPSQKEGLQYHTSTSILKTFL